MISFDQGQLKFTLSSLRTIGMTERAVAQMAVEEAGAVFHEKLKKNISMTDHTLDDLAAMDHPYARRHGAIKIHRIGSADIIGPQNRVHQQSGKMVSALYSVPTATTPGWRVGIDSSIAPHAIFVMYGTKLMLPRDVVYNTAGARETQKQMMRAVVRVLGKELRTKGSVRITAGGGMKPGGGV